MVTAQFVGYRRGLKSRQRDNQILLRIEGVQSKAAATRYLGKEIRWTSQFGRTFRGRITRLHGRRGTVRATLNKGFPSYAIGATVIISEK
jgi:ribosomal protein L35AE/L33A